VEVVMVADMKKFAAKFDTKCDKCGGTIVKSEYVYGKKEDRWIIWCSSCYEKETLIVELDEIKDKWDAIGAKIDSKDDSDEEVDIQPHTVHPKTLEDYAKEALWRIE